MFLLTKRSFEPIERIEFGFVLLPDDDVLQEIKQMSEIINSLLHPLVWRGNLSPFWGTYVNRHVVIPHISIGQYGVLGCEVERLKSIVQGACAQISQIREAMELDLSILENHIFFDLVNCFEHVNPEISRAYLILREQYFENIQTRFPIAQALMFKKEHQHKEEEINLINQYYQNWGMPEGDRIRPHFTLLYHPPYHHDEMKNTLENDPVLKKKLTSINEILFTRIGVVQIDPFGNPIKDGLLCVYPLNSG
jgi:hypothetical protein